MFPANFVQIGFLVLLAAFSNCVGFAASAKQHNYIELGNLKECGFPDFPDYGQTFNVTFSDNSTLNFESDTVHIPDEKQMVQFCRSGWWVSYDDFNYKTWYGDSFGQRLNFYFGVEAHPMSPTCGTPDAYFHTRQIRSARRIGFTDASPSATLFSEINYGGEKIVFKDGAELPHLPYEVKAFAVLNTGILFFEEENFQGATVYTHSAGCSTIGCNGEIVYFLCYNYDVPDSAHPYPFVPKSAKIVNRGPY